MDAASYGDALPLTMDKVCGGVAEGEGAKCAPTVSFPSPIYWISDLLERWGEKSEMRVGSDDGRATSPLCWWWWRFPALCGFSGLRA